MTAVQYALDGTCDVDECPNRPHARRMCNKHYLRWKRAHLRAGLPLPDGLGPEPRPVAEIAGNTPHDARYRERTRQRIRRNSKVNAAGCWVWERAVDRDGYGITGTPKRDSAHRAAYLAFKGPIAAGAVIDHRCHTDDHHCLGGSDCQHRRCVNPDHLELVTPDENTRRGRSPSAVNAKKTHCHRGHEFNAKNTINRPDGRACRACHNATSAASKRRRKEAQR